MKKAVIGSIEGLSVLAIGLLATVYVLKMVYANYGISFEGNVWVNWFALSYLLFGLYTIVIGFFISKKSIFFNKRLNSVRFWLLCLASLFIVVFPIAIGENPF